MMSQGGYRGGEYEEEDQGEGMGHETMEDMPGGLKRPYGAVQNMGAPPPMGRGITEGSKAEENLAKLPPDQQEMVMMLLGSDPLMASALLQVLGPSFAPIINKALKAQAPQTMDPMAGAGGIMPPGGAMG
jgi:hypothetical protein